MCRTVKIGVIRSETPNLNACLLFQCYARLRLITSSDRKTAINSVTAENGKTATIHNKNWQQQKQQLTAAKTTTNSNSRQQHRNIKHQHHRNGQHQ